jgi:uncharacterized protein (TIGR02246 family)
MTEPHEIHALLKRYEEALNQSDTSTVMKLYTPDGVFMAQHFPSNIGADAIRKAYDGVFGTIQLTVSFAIAEVVQVAPDWAFARTNSEGTVLVHATGQTAAEANQELFVLQRIDGEWKIARYCFSTTNPPRE